MFHRSEATEAAIERAIASMRRQARQQMAAERAAGQTVQAARIVMQQTMRGTLPAAVGDEATTSAILAATLPPVRPGDVDGIVTAGLGASIFGRPTEGER